MPAPTLTDRLFDDSDSGAIDPFALLEDWFAEAKLSETNDPNAMALATVDAAGMPDVRIVLMNGRDERGLIFYTNFGSEKGVQLQAHPSAAVAFHWKSQRRQVRARGPVEIVDDVEANAYFATRPRISQIGSHASNQSRPLAGKAELIGRVEALELEFPPGQPVTRPPYWSGFRLVPLQFEFWRDGQFRLHDRARFTRTTIGAPWSRQRLNP